MFRRLLAFLLLGLVAVAADEKANAGYAKLSFDILGSFPIRPPQRHAAAAEVEGQIPARIKAWSGRKVIVTGYMLPVKTEQGRVTELLLTPNTMASGNLNPFALNEWVVVRVRPGVVPQTLYLLSFYGTLKVGAMYDQGFLAGIYELTADGMSEIPVL